MSTVRFNHVEEFLQELDKDQDLIDRHIIRLTNRFTPTKTSPSIQSVHVLASVRMEGVGLLSGKAWNVKLEQYVGQRWEMPGGEGSQTHETMARAKEVHDMVGQWVQAHPRVQIRAGLFE